MARNRESDPFAPIQIAPDTIAPRSGLHDAVRYALHSRRRWFHAGVLAAGFAGAIPVPSSAAFPPVFPLSSLYPAGGGDGTRGFVLTGIDERDYSGRSVSAAGDVNGDGIGDVIVGAYGADPGGDSFAVRATSYSVPARAFRLSYRSRACTPPAAAMARAGSSSPASTSMTARAAQ